MSVIQKIFFEGLGCTWVKLVTNLKQKIISNFLLIPYYLLSSGKFYNGVFCCQLLPNLLCFHHLPSDKGKLLLIFLVNENSYFCLKRKIVETVLIIPPSCHYCLGSRYTFWVLKTPTEV